MFRQYRISVVEMFLFRLYSFCCERSFSLVRIRLVAENRQLLCRAKNHTYLYSSNTVENTCEHVYLKRKKTTRNNKPIQLVCLFNKKKENAKHYSFPQKSWVCHKLTNTYSKCTSCYSLQY